MASNIPHKVIPWANSLLRDGNALAKEADHFIIQGPKDLQVDDTWYDFIESDDKTTVNIEHYQNKFDDWFQLDSPNRSGLDAKEKFLTSLLQEPVVLGTITVAALAFTLYPCEVSLLEQTSTLHRWPCDRDETN